ncbi:MAG: hypothetical protein IPI67_36350 [Myxococcales bacterium]|nr:hypothetical protein [Myxococcales bacterium]
MRDAAAAEELAEPAPVPTEALSELPPEERCASGVGVGGLRAWPTASGREVSSRRGGVNVSGKLDALKPGYNCGGSPVGCAELSPLTATVAADDGTNIELRAGHNERGEYLALGRRHQFSIVWCGADDAGRPYAELRGASILDRTVGAPAAGCLMEVHSSAPLAKLEAWPRLPLAELSRKSVQAGGFNTEGWVSDRFVPKPCPKGRACKPQPPPHVTLSDAASSRGHSLVLMTPSPMKIPLGGPYQVSVALCGSSMYGGDNEGTLVALTRKKP